MTTDIVKTLRWWAELLDSRFRVPGTNIRFGLDPLLSLVPGIGDLASPMFAVVLIVQGLRQRVPRVVLLRMMINALIDALIGAVPVVGNVGDVFWRANTSNLATLERYARAEATAPSAGDYVFVTAMLFGCAMLLVIPIALGLWLAIGLWHWLSVA